jgi:phospholipase/lecithinase/hemolysin
MKGRVGLAVLAAYLALNIGPASAYTALFAFGDSLSDAGNEFILSGGMTPAAPYVDGHYSNGPTWVEDLSVALGLGTLTPSLSGGTDFAVGDATTGSASPIDLDYQVGAFEAYAASLTPATLNGALFTLDIGANDIFGALSDPSTAAEMVTAAANTAAAEVDQLHTDGARSFLYYEVPQLGLTPDVEALGSGVGTLADTLAQLFNATLLGDLTAIESGADPLKVFTLDTYDLLGDIVSDPQRYGFSNVTDPCIDTPACLNAVPAVQDTYLFWDGLHPTEGGHMLTAELAYALVAPEPATWAMMLIGFAGLGFASWRARRAAAARACQV